MSRIPRPVVSVLGEDVDVDVPGIVAIRASFLSEGLYDTEAGGDPDEEDLYEIEVTAPGEELLQSIVFPRLTPALPHDLAEAAEEEWVEQELPIQRFVLALAWELANADPSNWDTLCRNARVWGSWTVEEVLLQLPPDWTPVPLLPDED